VARSTKFERSVHQHTGRDGVAIAEVLQIRIGRKSARRPDFLAQEEPLEIRVRGRSVAVTMRTPGHDEELAAGFLVSEGLIHQRSDVIEISHYRERGTGNESNIVNVFLARSVAVDFEKLTRHVFASSSCGLCGKASIESVHQHFTPVESAITANAKTISRLPFRLRTTQKNFARTGGLHAAAVFDSVGSLLVAREDVGRHNAVDKVIGHGFLQRLLPFDQHILLVSGRASFEIMQKALAASIPIVCAVSAPSSLAVEFARESSQTLIGFLRGEGMNIYAGAQRIRKTD
jgi:FdhD protein